jgi:hypothetical protein
MEQSPSLEAQNHPTGQETYHLLWKQKIQLPCSQDLS